MCKREITRRFQQSIHMSGSFGYSKKNLTLPS